MKRLLTFALSAAFLSPLTVSAQETIKPLPETSAQHDARMNWFREARFGMFVHWGVYAVPAGEWDGKTNYGEWFLEETKMPVSQYEKYAANFNPTQFDAKTMVKLAKDAGMKYLVITSKHHDGFDMYPSQLGDWGLKRTPFKRDPLKELAVACQEAGLKLCFYHSIMDWHHEDYTPRRAWNDVAPQKAAQPDMDKYVTYLKGQLKELLTNYGPIGILWFDGEWEPSWTHERGVDLYNTVRSLQPNIIVNNRVGKGRLGMQGMNKSAGVGDYGTPEQEIPATGFGPGVDWESCMTMNTHWGYNKADNNWKSTEILVHNLIDCASKGGNYLLNVGPTAQGVIPAPSVERLQQIGAWMKDNSVAIYDTQASPFPQLDWGRVTQKRAGNTTLLYLHVWKWPTDGKLLVPGLNNAPRAAYILKGKRYLPVVRGSKGLEILVPETAPDLLSPTLVLQIEGAPDVQDPRVKQRADGTMEFPVNDAKTTGVIQVAQFEGKDNFGYWSNEGDSIEWTFIATRAGKYVVSAEISAPQKTNLNIVVGGKTTSAAIAETGNYSNYQLMTLGTIEIAAPGKMTLQLKPGDKWRAVNVRALKIQPAP